MFNSNLLLILTVLRIAKVVGTMPLSKYFEGDLEEIMLPLESDTHSLNRYVWLGRGIFINEICYSCVSKKRFTTPILDLFFFNKH